MEWCDIHIMSPLSLTQTLKSQNPRIYKVTPPMLCFMVNLMPSCVDWFQISKSKKKNKKRIQCHRQLCSNRPLFLHNPRLTLFLNCKKLLPFTTLTSSNLTRTIIVFFSLFLSHPFKVLSTTLVHLSLVSLTFLQ